jgi:hypothetical protein
VDDAGSSIATGWFVTALADVYRVYVTLWLPCNSVGCAYFMLAMQRCTTMQAMATPSGAG